MQRELMLTTRKQLGVVSSSGMDTVMQTLSFSCFYVRFLHSDVKKRTVFSVNGHSGVPSLAGSSGGCDPAWWIPPVLLTVVRGLEEIKRSL